MEKASEAPKMFGRGWHVTADTLLFEGVEEPALGCVPCFGGGIFRVWWRGSFCGKDEGSRCRSGSKVTFEGRGVGGGSGVGSRGSRGDGGVVRAASVEGCVVAMGEDVRGVAWARAKFGKALVGGRGVS